MRLIEMDQEENSLFECDRCRIVGGRHAFILEEEGGHFCFSCWHEKEQRTRFRSRAAVVES